MVFILLSRQLSGLRQLQAIGHQVVGSGNASHEDVQMMYNKFFGGETASVKTLLKEQFGSIKAGKMLNQIFKVYCLTPPPQKKKKKKYIYIYIYMYIIIYKNVHIHTYVSGPTKVNCYVT